MNEVVPPEKIKPEDTKAELESVLGLGKPASRLRRLRPVIVLGLVAATALLATVSQSVSLHSPLG